MKNKKTLGRAALVTALITGVLIGSSPTGRYPLADRFAHVASAEELSKENNSTEADMSSNGTTAIARIAIVNGDNGISGQGKSRTKYLESLLPDLDTDVFEFTGLSEAKAGVEGDKYAAYIIIPGDFSKSYSSVTGEAQYNTITYKLNPNLDINSLYKATKNIYSFYNELNNNMSYIYVHNIMDSFHEAQDGADTILANEKALNGALENVASPDFLGTIKVPEMARNASTAAIVDVSPFYDTYASAVSRVAEKYSNASNDMVTSISAIGNAYEDLIRDLEENKKDARLAEIKEQCENAVTNTSNSAVKIFNKTYNDVYMNSYYSALLVNSEASAVMNYTRQVNDKINDIVTSAESITVEKIREEMPSLDFSKNEDGSISISIPEDTEYYGSVSPSSINISVGDDTDDVKRADDLKKLYKEIMDGMLKCKTSPAEYLKKLDKEKYVKKTLKKYGYKSASRFVKAVSKDPSILTAAKKAIIEDGADTDAFNEAMKSAFVNDPGELGLNIPTAEAITLKVTSSPAVTVNATTGAVTLDVPTETAVTTEYLPTSDAITIAQSLVNTSANIKKYGEKSRDSIGILKSKVTGVIDKELDDKYLTAIGKYFDSNEESIQNFLTIANPYQLSFNAPDTSFEAAMVEHSLDNLQESINTGNDTNIKIIDDLYTDKEKFAGKVTKNISKAEKSSTETVKRAIADAKAVQKRSYKENSEILESFSGMLPYTKIGTQDNNEVYSFIVEPSKLRDDTTKIANNTIIVSANNQTPAGNAVGNNPEADTAEKKEKRLRIVDYILPALIAAGALLTIAVFAVARIHRRKTDDE